LANSVFLRELPVASPQNLVWVFSQTNDPSSYPEYVEYQRQSDLFEGVIASQWIGLNLGANDQSERVEGALVSGNYFKVLGVKAQLGRTLLPDDDSSPGTSAVAVISHNLWQRHFNADANVIGKSVVLNGVSFTVVGVAPRDFAGVEEAFPRQVWIPLMMQANVRPGPTRQSNGFDPFNNRSMRSLDVMARLKSGVTFRQAQAGMNVVAGRLAQNYPDFNRDFQISLYTAGNGRPFFRAMLKPVTKILLAVVALVLLIACANVANLLLARAANRRKEIAIRLTLGATRSRLIRQLLTESILLAVTGGLVGLILNLWLIKVLMALKPSVPLPVNVELQTDWRVLTFTVLLSLLAGIIFGLVPALQASKYELVPALKEQSQERRGSFFNLRNALVIGQVALSIVVLIGAGLFLRSLSNARSIDPGFDAEHVLVLSFNTAAQKYDATRAQQFYQQLSNRVQGIPGVESVSLAQSAPLSYFYAPALAAPTFVEGHEPPSGESPPFVGNNTIGPNFFRTLGVQLVSGREFTDQDREGATRVAIVNERFVRELLPNGNPIGQRVRVLMGQPLTWEIVGVVKDSKYRSLGEDSIPYVFLPYLQSPQPAMAVHVRTSGKPKELATAVRREVHALDPNLPAFNVMSLQDNVDISLFPARFGAFLLGVFGFLALLIASIGIYGVMSCAVSERTHEMGIRMALGARAGDVLRLVISRGMWLAVVGVLIGAGLALGATRVIRSYLYDVSATDPFTFVGIGLLLIAVALWACYVPARRATKVDPLVALKYE
jgi:predicted permease